MADETRRTGGEEEAGALKTYPVDEAHSREAERVKKSQEDGRKSGAYAPAFNPSFAPDVYIPGDEDKPTVLTTQGAHTGSAAIQAAAGRPVSESTASGGGSGENSSGSDSVQTTGTSEAEATTSQPSAASLLTGTSTQTADADTETE